MGFTQEQSACGLSGGIKEKAGAHPSIPRVLAARGDPRGEVPALALAVLLLCLQGSEAQGTGQALGHRALCAVKGRSLPQPGHGFTTEHPGKTREEEAKDLLLLSEQCWGLWLAT